MTALFQSKHSSQVRLSPGEILAISKEVNREYTPKFSSNISDSGIKLSANDMLTISEEISRDFAVRLPLYISQSVCVLMPVDPGHLHAYWHLDKKQLTRVNDSAADKALILRIFTRLDKNIKTTQAEKFFDIIVDCSETHQTISLPRSFTENNFSAVIGQRHADDKFVAFACSDITHLPRDSSVTFDIQKQAGMNAGISHFLTQNSSGKGKA